MMTSPGLFSPAKLPVLTYRTRAVLTNDAASYSHTSVAIGAEAVDRAVIVAVMGRNTTPTNFDWATVTIGGVSAIAAAQGGGSNAPSELWIAPLPNGTSITIDAASTGAVVSEYCAIAVWTVTGLANLTPRDTAVGLDGNILIDVEKNGIVVAAAILTNGSSATWSNATERFDAVNEGNHNSSGADYTGGATAEANRNIVCSVSNGAFFAAAAWR